MFRLGVEFGRVSILPAENVSRVFDDAALHSETYSQKRDFVFAGIFYRDALSVHAACAEAAGDKDAVSLFEKFRIFLKILCLDAFDVDFRVVRHSSVLKRFVDRFVGVSDRDVFSDKGYCAFVFRLCRLADKGVPLGVDDRFYRKFELLKDPEVELLFQKFARNCIN